MDASVIAAIIAVLGTGFLAMLGFFLRGIRSDIAALRAEIAGLRAEMHTEIAGLRAEMHTEIAGLRAEMHTEIAGLRAEVVRLGQSVARLEGTVAEHGRQIGRFAGYGERIVALEAADFAT